VSDRRDGGGELPPGALSALLREVVAAPPDAGRGGLSPGDVVGRFEIVRELGRGGFGVVYEARDRELGRAVAFKLVRPGSGAGGAAGAEARLLREAETIARLSHPGIVTLYDLGKAPQGPYLVMELLHGQTLAERMALGPMSVAEALRVGADVARALAHAHERGVVHRDLTPANVFVCEDGQVKLLDLGLAHAFGHRRLSGGTPAYMAPEQWQGAPEDERTDVFALGVLLFRLLSGGLPYPEDGGRWIGGARRPTVLAVSQAPAVGPLVARMLDRDPVARPRDAGEVVKALAALATEAARSTSSDRPGAPLVGRRLAVAGWVALGVAVGAVAVLAAVRLAGVGPPLPGRPDGRLVVALADTDNATGQPALDALDEALASSLAASRRLAVVPRQRLLDLLWKGPGAEAAPLDAAGLEAVARVAGAQVTLVTSVRSRGEALLLEVRAADVASGRDLFSLRETVADRAQLLPTLSRLADRVRRELQERPEEVAGAQVALAAALTPNLEALDHYTRGLDADGHLGELATAVAEYRRAVELDPDFGAAHLQLALALWSYGRHGEARAHWTAALAAVGRLPPRERLLLEKARARNAGDQDELVRGAEELAARLPDDPMATCAAADTLLTLGRAKRAGELFLRAVATDPGHYWAAMGAVRSLARAGRAGEAVALARRAVATRESPGNVSTLAYALANAGDGPGAREAARRAFALAAERPGASLYVTWFAAPALMAVGALDEAEQLLVAAAAAARAPEDRDAARQQLLEVLSLSGRRREAEALLEAAAGVEAWAARPGLRVRLLEVGRDRRAAKEAAAALRAGEGMRLKARELALLGDAAGAAKAAEGLPPGSPQERQYRAARLLAEGRLEDSLGLQRELLSAGAIEGLEVGARTLLGETLAALQRDEEALAALEGVEGVWLMEGAVPLDAAVNVPRALLLRARASQRLGRAGEARRALERFMAGWARADADLPLLAEARALAGRIGDRP